MFIDLPDSYCYNVSKNERSIARIRESVLMVNEGISFNDLMYALTYRMKGKRYCKYCGQYIPKEKITLDHIWPRDLGGPTITTNLNPSCCKCNSDKANMTMEEYMLYQGMSKPDKTNFIRDIYLKHEKIKHETGFILPIGWGEMIPIKEVNSGRIKKNVNIELVEQFYKVYRNLRKPIVVDRNGFLLDGLRVFLFARKIQIRHIPAIILDNVEVVRKKG